ncbi:MAG: RDD family protein, partial [Oscillospiraceae bacterium]|nr:RDD family protein [Oscillospiraceae bacterium]
DAATALPPEGQPEAFRTVFARYDEAFQFGLILWFAYETLITLLLNGRTIGKLIMGLRIVPMNPGRSRILNFALLPVRSFLKVLSLYLLQAFPFLICALTVFTSSSRSGFDFFVRTKVVEKGTG